MFFATGGPSRRLIIVAAVLMAALVFAALQIRERLLYLHEEDARIRAEMVTVASRVPGWIVSRPVQEGQVVEPGTVLVVLDQRDAEQAHAELAAQLDAIVADKARLRADISLARAQTDGRLRSARAELESANVTVSSLDPQLKLAQSSFVRSERLFEQKMTSQAQRDQAEVQLQSIEREHRIANADLRSAEARVEEAEAERARLEVLAAQRTVLEMREAELAAKLRRQQLDLEDRIIKSPSGGVVDRVFVEPGEYVTPGQRLLLMHDPDKVWIEANIKETQLRRLAVGQQVLVHVDAYPDENFEGAVERIGYSATSTFALLPTPNPSGNFTKITQRVPVRIAIAQREGTLRPGMMVEVKIATSP